MAVRRPSPYRCQSASNSRADRHGKVSCTPLTLSAILRKPSTLGRRRSRKSLSGGCSPWRISLQSIIRRPPPERRSSRRRRAGTVSEDNLTKRDKSQILIAEYNTLRAEILQRSSWQIQMWTVAGAQVVVILGFAIIYSHIYAGVIMLCITTLIVGWSLLYNDQDMRIIAHHVRALEVQINALADDELLSWERERGGLAAIGYGERLKRLFSGASN